MNHSYENLDVFIWKKEHLDLRYINLSFNNLTNFSWKNCPCKNLKKINLTCNKLTSFSFENCPNSLEEIDLSHNFIVNLKGPFPKKLKILNLSTNKIKKIPQEYFKNCNNLNNLNLQNNKISEWVWGMKYLRRLSYFNICHNNLKNFSWYMSPRSLQWVDLSFNRLFDFYFINCPNLNVLYIQDINLRRDVFTWENIPITLKEIDLTCNYLINFTWTNCECKELNKIYLTKCRIKKFSWENSPKKLKYIYLKENNFDFYWKNCPDIKVVHVDKIINFKDSPDSLNKLTVLEYNLDYDDKDIPLSLENIECGSMDFLFIEKECFNYIKHQSKKLRIITDSIRQANLIYSEVPVLKKYACREYYEIKNYFKDICN